jgi:hypothetical protein
LPLTPVPPVPLDPPLVPPLPPLLPLLPPPQASKKAATAVDVAESKRNCLRVNRRDDMSLFPVRIARALF